MIPGSSVRDTPGARAALARKRQRGQQQQQQQQQQKQQQPLPLGNEIGSDPSGTVFSTSSGEDDVGGGGGGGGGGGKTHPRSNHSSSSNNNNNNGNNNNHRHNGQNHNNHHHHHHPPHENGDPSNRGEMNPRAMDADAGSSVGSSSYSRIGSRGNEGIVMNSSARSRTSGHPQHPQHQQLQPQPQPQPQQQQTSSSSSSSAGARNQSPSRTHPTPRKVSIDPTATTMTTTTTTTTTTPAAASSSRSNHSSSSSILHAHHRDDMPPFLSSSSLSSSSRRAESPSKLASAQQAKQEGTSSIPATQSSSSHGTHGTTTPRRKPSPSTPSAKDVLSKSKSTSTSTSTGAVHPPSAIHYRDQSDHSSTRQSHQTLSTPQPHRVSFVRATTDDEDVIRSSSSSRHSQDADLAATRNNTGTTTGAQQQMLHTRHRSASSAFSSWGGDGEHNYHQQDYQDEPTPLDAPSLNRVGIVDAATIREGTSQVFLKPYKSPHPCSSSPLIILVVEPETKRNLHDQHHDNDQHGNDHATANADQNHNHNDQNRSKHHHTQKDPPRFGPPPVRYGQTIRIVTTDGTRALGVSTTTSTNSQTKTNTNSNADHDEGYDQNSDNDHCRSPPRRAKKLVEWFPPSPSGPVTPITVARNAGRGRDRDRGGRAVPPTTSTFSDEKTLWNLLSTHPRQHLWVGPAAVEPTQDKYAASTKKKSTSTSPAASWALRSGDAVLLRHKSTGSILSISNTDRHRDEHRFVLITDSYQHTASHQASAAPLDRIQHHDRFLPTSSELFQFIFSHVPPCPTWSYHQHASLPPSLHHDDEDWREARDNYRRGRHLGLEPNMNGVNLGRLRNASSQVQEQVLLDEIIGSLLGLEGNFVTIRRKQPDDTNCRGGPSHRHQLTFALGNDANVPLNIDSSYQNLMDFILPLSSAFLSVSRFVEDHQPGYEYGNVMQALCQVFDEMIIQDEYFVKTIMEIAKDFRRGGILRDPNAPYFLVPPSSSSAHTNKQPMTLNQLFVRIQKPKHTFSILERVILDVRDKKGGALLNALYDLQTNLFAGDVQAHGLLQRLLDHASVPYMTMLSAWLQRGVLPATSSTTMNRCNEFMVEHNFGGASAGGGGDADAGAAAAAAAAAAAEAAAAWGSAGDAGYDGDNWNKIFCLREEHVLKGVLSTSSLQRKILMTGKYWNAIQYCETGTLVVDGAAAAILSNVSPNDNSHNDDDDDDDEIPPLSYRMDSVSMASYVDRMFQTASTELLRIILCDYRLDKTLMTMKRYFLLDQGDFLLNFWDLAAEELGKEVGDISRGRVQHWLNLAVQQSETMSSSDDTASVSTSSFPGTAATSQPLLPSHLVCAFAKEGLLSQLDSLRQNASGGGGGGGGGGSGAGSFGILGGATPQQKHTEQPQAQSTRTTMTASTPSRQPYGASKASTGMMAFTLDFSEVPFPTSLVISRNVHESYQLLFRHLFFAKYVQRRLTNVWLDHQVLKRLEDVRAGMGPTYCLRHRMTHFLQTLIHYMMMEVIEPNWQDMCHQMSQQIQHVVSTTTATNDFDAYDDDMATYPRKASSSTPTTRNRRFRRHGGGGGLDGLGGGSGSGGGRIPTVDHLIDLHDTFLHKTLEQCLLSNRTLIQTVTRILSTCLLFADQMHRFMETTRINEENQEAATQAKSMVQRNLQNRETFFMKSTFIPNATTTSGGGGATAGDTTSGGLGGSESTTSNKAARVEEALRAEQRERKERLAKQTARVHRELTNESYNRMIGRYTQVFEGHVADLAQQLQIGSTTATTVATRRHQEQIANLLVQLDLNGPTLVARQQATAGAGNKKRPPTMPTTTTTTTTTISADR